MHIEIIGKPLWGLGVQLDLDSCMATLTAEVAQGVIDTVNKTYMTHMHVSAGSALLGTVSLIYWMTLSAAPQQNADEYATRKALALLVGMISFAVALKLFSNTRNLYYGRYTEKYLPQLNRIIQNTTPSN